MNSLIGKRIEKNMGNIAEKIERHFNLETIQSIYGTTVYIQLKDTIISVYEKDISELVSEGEQMEDHQLINLVADDTIEFFINEMSKVREHDIFMEHIKIQLGKI